MSSFSVHNIQTVATPINNNIAENSVSQSNQQNAQEIVARLENENVALQRMQADLENRLQASVNGQIDLSISVEDLTSRHTEQTKKVDALMQQIVVLVEDKGKLSSEMVELQDALHRKNGEIVNANDETSRTQKKLKKALEDVKRLKDNTKDLEKIINRFRQVPLLQEKYRKVSTDLTSLYFWQDLKCVGKIASGGAPGAIATVAGGIFLGPIGWAAMFFGPFVSAGGICWGAGEIADRQAHPSVTEVNLVEKRNHLRARIIELGHGLSQEQFKALPFEQRESILNRYQLHRLPFENPPIRSVVRD